MGKDGLGTHRAVRNKPTPHAPGEMAHQSHPGLCCPGRWTWAPQGSWNCSVPAPSPPENSRRPRSPSHPVSSFCPGPPVILPFSPLSSQPTSPGPALSQAVGGLTGCKWPLRTVAALPGWRQAGPDQAGLSYSWVLKHPTCFPPVSHRAYALTPAWNFLS